MGQYVKRAGKTYYKGDDGKLYSDFQAANQARIGRSPESQFLGGIGDILRETFIGTARKAKAEPGVQADPSLLDRVWAGFGSVPIRTGLDEAGNVDLRKSDEYKRFAFTPEGQFERYFKTPEMDQYFGAASRGAAAPKDVQAMQALAGQTVAPGKTPEELSAFYRAESAMGRAQMPQIQETLGYKKDSDLAKWAEANPMLAQRLYAKEMRRREAAGQGTPGTTYAGVTPQPFGDESFSVAANAVPAPWHTQGNKVSGEFAGVVPFQAAKTTGEGMPDFQTTLGQRAEQLISSVKRDRGIF